MEIKKGIPASAGYAVGEAFVLDTEEYLIHKRLITENAIKSEAERLEATCDVAIEELKTHLDKFKKKVGEIALKIVEAHIAMLKDQYLRAEIVQAIKDNKYSAEYAVSRTFARKKKSLSDWGNNAFAQRALEDLSEIEKILIRNLLGSKRQNLAHLDKEVIVVARDLSPTQTISLDREKVIGILTNKGSRTSHAALIASSLGIPAIVGLENITADISGGDTVILDGTTGTVIINPDEETLKRYQAMKHNFYVTERRIVKELRNLPAQTKDGKKIIIYANIESSSDIGLALENGAEGIGLYRTEFLYLENDFAPREEDHLDAYTKAASILGQKKLTIRTLDLGADKMPLDGLPKEDNPFLGTRAIRLCFQKQELFKTQLGAILKASRLGNISIMFPMVSTYGEMLQLNAILKEVKDELAQSKEEFNKKVEVGIMIEVPSAAMIADLLITQVDFFSIGSNDLIAYTIAVDRLNENVASLYQPVHPAILRMLKHIIDVADKHGKYVSLCGEMASDPTYTLLLLGLGLRVFSIVPRAIPEVKNVIRSVTIDEAKAIADKAFTFSDGEETLSFLRSETKKIIE